jgi:argininosuccinate synthase
VTTRIVFPYSGEADAWPAIAAAAALQGAEIVTLTLDLGQGTDLEEVRDRALAAGAVRAHVLDVREEFARDYVLPALRADALQADPTALALAEELTSRKLGEVAAIEGAAPAADAAVVRETLVGRRGAAYTLTKTPADAPPTPAHVEIAFERGVPTAINGVPLPLTELIEILAIIAGHHGVGRIDRGSGIGDQGSEELPSPDPRPPIPDPRLPIPDPRSCVEAPAAVVLCAAYRALGGGAGSGAATGSVRIKLFKGELMVESS